MTVGELRELRHRLLRKKSDETDISIGRRGHFPSRRMSQLTAVEIAGSAAGALEIAAMTSMRCVLHVVL